MYCRRENAEQWGDNTVSPGIIFKMFYELTLFVSFDSFFGFFWFSNFFVSSNYVNLCKLMETGPLTPIW